MKKRVLCAMSGGVDSSVAAALLQKQGYEVIGIFMKFWAPSYAKASEGKHENICCSVEAATAARAVANKLGIRFYVLNLEKEFKKAVVNYYLKEYEAGRTPNPCTICNRDIKGEILLKKSLELEADFLATGHYARLRREIPNPKSQIPKYYLLQAKDKEKDQTYFLWMLKSRHLRKMLFPIGDFTKSEVRQMAKTWHLPTAERKDSQGLCFIPSRDTAGFLMRHARRLKKPGPILDKNGKKLGTHQGLINYTVGQRERLGLGGPKAYYVINLMSKENILVIGDEKDLYRKELLASDLNWITQKPSKTDDLSGKIRYRQPQVNCQLEEARKNELKVIFQKPQRAITPGQSIVFYAGEEVVGGGVID